MDKFDSYVKENNTQNIAPFYIAFNSFGVMSGCKSML